MKNDADGIDNNINATRGEFRLRLFEMVKEGHLSDKHAFELIELEEACANAYSATYVTDLFKAATDALFSQERSRPPCYVSYHD